MSLGRFSLGVSLLGLGDLPPRGHACGQEGVLAEAGLSVLSVWASPGHSSLLTTWWLHFTPAHLILTDILKEQK